MNQYNELRSAALAFIALVARIDQSKNSDAERVELMHEAKILLDEKVTEINREYLQ